MSFSFSVFPSPIMNIIREGGMVKMEKPPQKAAFYLVPKAGLEPAMLYGIIQKYNGN